MNAHIFLSRPPSQPEKCIARSKSRKTLLRWVLILTILTGQIWSLARPALAHGSYTRSVPRMASGRTAPSVDGLCSPAEYPTEYFGSSQISIPYSPLYGSSAAVRALANSSDLYVCVSGLAVRTGTAPNPYLALYFDVTHLAGRTPQNDDLLFRIFETGGRSVLRGNGTTYTAASDITNWAAVRTTGDMYWSAEFRISLSLLRGGVASQSIGFTVRHQAYDASHPDSFFWPPNSQSTNPSAWADLVWAPSITDNAHLDVYRITQGMEYDTSGTVFYDLVAGKDTLARAQLYTVGATRTIAAASCQFQQITQRNTSDAYVPVSGRPLRVQAAAFNPSPTLNIAPNSVFSGGPTIDCWIPGTQLAEAGDYRFELRVQVTGASDQTIPLGTRRFLPTADLRVYLHRWVNTNSSGSRTWGEDINRNIPIAMLEANRMYPVRTGTGLLNETGQASSQSTGLRYLVNPTVGVCPLTDTLAECDARSRNDSNRAMLDHNARLLRLDRADGQHRDRLDWGSVLEALNATGGGQSCWGNHRVAGSGFDANIHGAAASVVAHEIAHCMGQVSSGSPNSNGGMHSRIGDIPLYRNGAMANTRLREYSPTVLSLMFPAVGSTDNTFSQGWEWNELRNTLLTMWRPSMPQELAPQGTTLFEFAALLNQNDTLTVTYSALVEDLPLELSSEQQGSSYALNFYNSDGKLQSRFGFEPDFSSLHGEPSDVTGLFLVVPLPADSAWITISKGDVVIYDQMFTANAPVVQNLSLDPDGLGNFTLTWEASDVDDFGESSLQYSIYFAPSADQPPLLLTDNVTGTIYVFSTAYAPGATAAQLFVQASDGFNTSAMLASEPFSIEDKQPQAVIQSPAAEEQFVEKRPVTLAGTGFDYTSGPIDSQSLEWYSDVQGLLGVGEHLDTLLAPGLHTITLVVKAPSGLTNQDSVVINVVADNDGDGLSDDYENGRTCLDSNKLDSDLDADNDGLANLGESFLYLDPCNNDSDNDGFNDGDETWQGSDPLDSFSVPPEETLALDQTPLQLSCAQGNPSAVLVLQTLKSETDWWAASNSSWVALPGSGTGDSNIPISLDCTGLASGLNTAQIMITTGMSQARFIDIELLNSGAASSSNLYLPVMSK